MNLAKHMMQKLLNETNIKRPIPLPKKEMARIGLNLKQPSIKVPNSDPITSPRNTRLPSAPNSTFGMFKSFLIATAAEGSAPWSTLINISRKNRNAQTNQTVAL